MAQKRHKINWALIEPAWRAGIKPQTHIAKDYFQATGRTVSCTAMVLHFGNLGIERDLGKLIRSRAKSLADSRMSPRLTDEEIIEEGAIAIAEVLTNQRKDIAQARELGRKLFAEMSAITDNLELFQKLDTLLASGDAAASDEMAKAYRRVIEMPSRIRGTRDLAETLKVLITLERDAFGIDNAKSPGKTLDDFLDGLASASGGE